jgi:VCBS repeat-containing protein
MVGLNGVRVTSQLAASALFEGFFDDGTPVEFRGEPGTIGIQSGFTTAAIDALGGGLSEVAVRITLYDGDTTSSDFDFNENKLRLNGVEMGDFSAVETQVTSSDGLTNLGSNFGFLDGSLNTGWFYSNNTTFLSDFYATLSSGEVQFQLSDADPFDNYFDFTQGVDGGLINVGQPPNVAPVAKPDHFAIDENVSIVGSLFADNGNGIDSDADGHAMQIIEVDGSPANIGSQIALASGALLNVNTDGTFAYDTNGQFDHLNHGEQFIETFAYSISDGNGGTSSATVEIVVNGVSGEDDCGCDDAAAVKGTETADTMRGSRGDDHICGLGGDDTITGGIGNDMLKGGSGRDTLNGGIGEDILKGGEGDDTLDGGNDNDHLNGGIGFDLLAGGNGFDTLKGDVGNDTLEGGNGDDLLDGGADNDTLSGGNGMDSLEGGAGNDSLSGGNHTDTFVFRAGFGNDIVNDFRLTGADHDILQFDVGLFADALDLFSHSADTSDGIMITSDGGDTLLVKNISLAQLQAHPEDLHFV